MNLKQFARLMIRKYKNAELELIFSNSCEIEEDEKRLNEELRKLYIMLEECEKNEE